MSSARKDRICALLKGIETGDPESVEVVSPVKYIQHNPQTSEGGEGLAALFKRLSKTSPSVNIVRIFSDGDYVFAHTEYEFSVSRVGFEVFRFEDDFAVEHWDNIQSRRGPNSSGRSMVDGETEASDLELTDSNRELVRSFVETVLIGGRVNSLGAYVNEAQFREHNPFMGDDLSTLRKMLESPEPVDLATLKYQKLHRVLAEGDFVLTVCEGVMKGNLASFYDLFRVVDGRIIEHWDTTEKIPPLSEWKNDNGKF